MKKILITLTLFALCSLSFGQTLKYSLVNRYKLAGVKMDTTYFRVDEIFINRFDTSQIACVILYTDTADLNRRNNEITRMLIKWKGYVSTENRLNDSISTGLARKFGVNRGRINKF